MNSDRVIIFTPSYDHEDGQALVTRRVVEHSLRMSEVPVTLVYSRGFSFKGLFTWMLAVVRLFLLALRSPRSSAIYVVCSRTSHGFLRDVPVLALALLGRRILAHCHGSDFFELLDEAWVSRLARRLYVECEVIFPCAHLCERAAPRVRRAHVCENFFSGSKIDESHIPSSSGPLRVLWNSNIMATKGLCDVVEALADLVNDGFEVDFLCFGRTISDPECTSQKLEEKLAQWSSYPWFNYLGRVSHPRALEVLSWADVVALPSRYKSEMQPLAIIEAMCLGKHVIISNRKSLLVTVGDYPAIAVHDSNQSELKLAFARLLAAKTAAPDQFLFTNYDASLEAVERYSANAFDERLKAIFNAH